MSLIVHAVPADDWSPVPDAGQYRHDTLDAEGFVHCSTPDRIAGLVNAAGTEPTREWLLLCIDTDLLAAEVRYGGDERHPRVYGPVDGDAVVDVVEFPTDDRGRFYVPDRVHDLAASS